MNINYENITVVIASFKSDIIIHKCLRSINSKCPIIVVENSSNDIFKKSLEEKYKNVQCVLNGNNYGYGKSNNIGISKAKTKFVLILNPDSELKTNTLDNFLKAANKLQNFAILAPINSNDEQLMNLDNEAQLEIYSEQVKGYALFLNLDEFKEIGFFDENFFLYYEELDLCRRLIKNKKKIFIITYAKINHFGGKSHNPDINYKMELSRNWHLMWSFFYFYKKHYNYFYAFLKTFKQLLSSLIKTVFFFIFFRTKKYQIYKQRLSGLLNSMLGKSAWYRPDV